MGKDFVNLPLEIYAEFAAHLSPKSMELLLRRRRAACAAVLIQYRVRVWLEKRMQLAVFGNYIFNVWRRLSSKNGNLAAAQRLCACCKKRIAQSLLRYLAEERVKQVNAGRKILARWRKYRLMQREKISSIVACMQKYLVQNALGNKTILTKHYEWVKKPRFLPVHPVPPDTAVEQVSRMRLITEDLVLGGIQRVVAPPEARKRRARIFSSYFFHDEKEVENGSSIKVKESVLNRGLREEEIRAGRRILFALKARMKRLKLYNLKLAILVRLVTRIQAMFRGAKAREAVGKQKQRVALEKKRREMLDKMKAEIALTAKRKIEEEIERQKRLKIRKQRMMETAKSNQLTVPSALAHMFSPESEVFLPHGDNADIGDRVERSAVMSIKSRIFSFLSQHSLRWLRVHALVLSVVGQTIEAVKVKDDAVEDQDKTLVDLEPVDVLFPKDVQGLLARGVVVDSASPIRGSKLDAGARDGWIVDELTDAEQYDLQYEMIKKAAIRIQRFYRRHLSRRKFLAYLNEKDLNTVRAEQEAYARANEDAAKNGEDPSLQPPSDAVNTDGCSVM